jgi:AcrR family transcriptional regulator
MPKIISNVEQTIKNCAKELFTQSRYSDVDMKVISAKSGIAVGTIYHYFHNKECLYLCVLKESWEKTFSKLDEINTAKMNKEEKLNRFIVTLYLDIKSRKGLGKILLFNDFKEELKDSTILDQLKKKLLSSLCCVISQSSQDLSQKPESEITKWSEVLLVSILAMIEFHPNDDGNNIRFLTKLFGFPDYPA